MGSLGEAEKEIRNERDKKNLRQRWEKRQGLLYQDDEIKLSFRPFFIGESPCSTGGTNRYFAAFSISPAKKVTRTLGKTGGRQ